MNAVAPGIIKTPMHPVETHNALAGFHPLGRMGEVADIVDAILYLESASFVPARPSTSMAARARAIEFGIHASGLSSQRRTI